MQRNSCAVLYMHLLTASAREPCRSPLVLSNRVDLGALQRVEQARLLVVHLCALEAQYGPRGVVEGPNGPSARYERRRGRDWAADATLDASAGGGDGGSDAASER